MLSATLRSRLPVAGWPAALGMRSWASSAASPEAAGALPTLPPFDHVPLPYDGPSKEEVMAMRQEYMNPAKVLDHYSYTPNHVTCTYLLRRMSLALYTRIRCECR